MTQGWTKQDILDEIRKLEPNGYAKLSWSAEKLAGHLSALNYQIAQENRRQAARDRAEKIGKAIGYAPEHGVLQYDQYEEEQGANFMVAQGWAIANTLPRLVSAAKHLAEIKGCFERYRALKGREGEHLSFDDGTEAMITPEDVQEALEDLCRKIAHTELPSIARLLLSDLRGEVARQDQIFLKKRQGE